MTCAKCGQENLKAVEFCVRCHYPLRFTCPACKNIQMHGGTCDKCGADFAKYAAMLIVRAQLQEEQSREAKKSRTGPLIEVLLAIVTLGLSLMFAIEARQKEE